MHVSFHLTKSAMDGCWDAIDFKWDPSEYLTLGIGPAVTFRENRSGRELRRSAQTIVKSDKDLIMTNTVRHLLMPMDIVQINGRRYQLIGELIGGLCEFPAIGGVYSCKATTLGGDSGIADKVIRNVHDSGTFLGNDTGTGHCKTSSFDGNKACDTIT
jgi:hypothetical protein